MGYSDDDWCAWCGKQIIGTGQRHDGRAFCTLHCVGCYQLNSDDDVAVIDLSARRGAPPNSRNGHS